MTRQRVKTLGEWLKARADAFLEKEPLFGLHFERRAA